MLILKQSIAKYQSVDMNIPRVLVWAERNTLKHKMKMFRVNKFSITPAALILPPSFTCGMGKPAVFSDISEWYSNPVTVLALSASSLGRSQSQFSLWQLHSHPLSRNLWLLHQMELSKELSHCESCVEVQAGVQCKETSGNTGEQTTGRGKITHYTALALVSSKRGLSLLPSCWSWPSAVPTVCSSPSTGMGGLKRQICCPNTLIALFFTAWPGEFLPLGNKI